MYHTSRFPVSLDADNFEKVQCIKRILELEDQNPSATAPNTCSECQFPHLENGDNKTS